MEFTRCQTNGGLNVIIYNKEAGGNFPIHGAFESGNEWIPAAWTLSGFKFQNSEHPLDITKAVINGEV